ncbi:hypothetical protein [Kordiimonas gwangyangensis]|nr:hypothetical protein [Kordiimonas gwangyangensis]
MALSLFVPNLTYTLVSQIALARLVEVPVFALARAIAAPFFMTVVYGGLLVAAREVGVSMGVVGTMPMLILSAAVTLVAAPVLLSLTRSPLIESVKSFLPGR